MEKLEVTCKNQIGAFSNTILKIKSRQSKDLNVRLDAIKLLGWGETLRGKHRTLFDINHSTIFLDPPPRLMKTKMK